MNFSHWVKLHESPIDDDFNGEFGTDVWTRPRIKIAYEVSLKSEEKAKKKKKTKETASFEEGEDDSSWWKIIKRVPAEDIKSKMSIIQGEPEPVVKLTSYVKPKADKPSLSQSKLS